MPHLLEPTALPFLARLLRRGAEENVLLGLSRKYIMRADPFAVLGASLHWLFFFYFFHFSLVLSHAKSTFAPYIGYENIIHTPE